jgi:hypothetical protein
MVKSKHNKILDPATEGGSAKTLFLILII